MMKNSNNRAKAYIVLKDGKKIFVDNSANEIKMKMNNNTKSIIIRFTNNYGDVQIRNINKSDILCYEEIES